MTADGQTGAHGGPCLATRANGAGAAPLGAGCTPLRVVLYQFFPGGGIGRYSHELMRHFGDEVDAELVCLPSFHWRGQAQYAVWPELREIGHVRPWRRRLNFLVGQFVNPRRLFHHAVATRADVVHLSNINHLTFPLWERWLRRARLKIVATAHDVRRPNPMLNRRYEDRQLRRFYRRADALFVHSRSQAADLADFAAVDPARVHIVPHGPYDYGPASASKPLLRSRWGLPQDKKLALFFGNIRDEKNLALLLEAAVPFKDTLHIVVAGQANVPGHRQIGFYRELAESLQLNGSVTFLTGYLPDAQVPDLFAACDWAAMAYGSAFTSQSGVLNVALQHRLPVLASRAPTFAEVLEGRDLGVLVEPDSREALAQGIVRLHERLSRPRDFEFDEYLREFSWAENARRTVAVYRSLCGRSRAAG